MWSILTMILPHRPKPMTNMIMQGSTSFITPPQSYEEHLNMMLSNPYSCVDLSCLKFGLSHVPEYSVELFAEFYAIYTVCV